MGGKTTLWIRSLPPARICQFSPDEKRVALGVSGNIEIIDADTGTTVSQCIDRNGSVKGLAFSPDGRTLASHSDAHQQITLWHVATGRELLTINPGLKVIRSLEFSSDGQWLVAAGQNLNGYGEVVLLRGRGSE
jgi:WD40 repeat protein